MSTDQLPTQDTASGPNAESDPFAESTRESSPASTQKKTGIGVRASLMFLALLLLIGVGFGIVYVASTTAKSGPNLTHTIGRNDLTVTVTEQGTLESSDNTEIKCKVRGYSTVTWVIPGGTQVEPGDELVRLDTKRIEDAIRLHTTDTYTAQATLERSKANVAQAEIAEEAYLQGSYKTKRQTFERDIKVKQRNLEIAKKMLANSKSMFNRGYVSELEVEGNEFTVTQAKLELEVAQTQLDVLEKYTKQMELETIRGNLKASKSKLQADESGLAMDSGRKAKAESELKDCVIVAPRKGLVIYPSAAAWKDTPDVTEGATVRKDQVLLLMPDLEKMQVKVGIHESMIDRVKVGMIARVTLSEMVLEGRVGKVAAVAQPAGWWTGNVVKYDVIVDIPSAPGLKPGMSAEVEVLLAEYQNEITIPVAAIVETEFDNLCWVKTEESLERRSLQLGDGNDVFVIVEAGLQPGDEVVLNPRAFIEEAKNEILGTFSESESDVAVIEGEQDTSSDVGE